MARWRVYRGGSTLHRPEPLLTELHRESAARWCDELDGSGDDGLPEDAVRVGFDADGRPLIARAITTFGGGEGRHHLIRYGSGLDGSDELIYIRRDDGNRRRVVVIDLYRDAAGRVIETRDDEDLVVGFRYDGDGRVLERTKRTPDGVEVRHACDYDEHGELARIVRADDGGRVVWEAIRDRHEPDLPLPEELAEQAAPGIVAALAAGIEAAARELPQPVYALLGLRGTIEPSCVVVDRAAVASLVAHADDPVAPLRLGGDDPGTAEVDVVVHADAATCQRLRQWRQREELALWEEQRPSTAPAITRLGETVMEQLAARVSLPLLPVGPSPAGAALLDELRAELPAPHVAPPLPATLPDDRPGLRALLREQGLGEESAERIAAAAQVAIGSRRAGRRPAAAHATRRRAAAAGRHGVAAAHARAAADAAGPDRLRRAAAGRRAARAAAGRRHAAAVRRRARRRVRRADPRLAHQRRRLVPRAARAGRRSGRAGASRRRC